MKLHSVHFQPHIKEGESVTDYKRTNKKRVVSFHVEDPQCFPRNTLENLER
jgi:hypothetical protein